MTTRKARTLTAWTLCAFVAAVLPTVRGVRATTAPPSAVAVTVRAASAVAETVSWQTTSGANDTVERFDDATRRWKIVFVAPHGVRVYRDASLASDDAPTYTYRVCRRAPVSAPLVCSTAATARRQFDHPANFTHLDYGLYWARCGACRADGLSDEVKALPHEHDAYVDPSHPTIIFIHGWEPGTTVRLSRQSWLSPLPTGRRDLAAAWRARGYNVGVFYWNQFADDDCCLIPTAVEKKVWVGEPLTYRVLDATTGTLIPVKTYPGRSSVSSLFVRAYLGALHDVHGAEVRLAGHSLGAQLAVHATYLLSRLAASGEIAPALVPRRVALLDPFFGGAQPYLSHGRGTADETAYEVGALRGGPSRVVFEYDSSSLLPVAGGVASEMALTYVNTRYAGLDETEAHLAAIHWYLDSLGDPPKAASGGSPPSAALGDSALGRLAGTTWLQMAGQDTPDAGDDVFRRG